MNDVLMQYNYFVSTDEARAAVDPFVEKLTSEDDSGSNPVSGKEVPAA